MLIIIKKELRIQIDHLSVPRKLIMWSFLFLYSMEQTIIFLLIIYITEYVTFIFVQAILLRNPFIM